MVQILKNTDEIHEFGDLLRYFLYQNFLIAIAN